MTDIELSAQHFLEDLGINSYPINPFEICQSLNIKIFESKFDRLEGVLLYDGKIGLIGLNSNQTYYPRKKFSVSHELGHFNNDIKIGTSSTFHCTKKMIEGFDKSNNIEFRADRFASELLLPKGMVKNIFDLESPSWDTINKVATDFEVSLMSSAFKYIDMSKSSCCLVVSKDNLIQFYKPSKTFRYSLQMKDSRILSIDSYAYKSAKGIHLKTDFELLSADIWITGRNVTKDSELYEWSMPLNSFGQVLTILWDDESVINDDNDLNQSNNPYNIEEKKYSYGGSDNFPWKPPHL